MDKIQEMKAAVEAQVAQSNVVGMIQIALIAEPNGSIQVRVSSSLTDVFQALGVLEVAKDSLKSQAAGPAPSKLVRASGAVPRVGA